MSYSFPMIPNFSKKDKIKDKFFVCNAEIVNKQNSSFNIEIMGSESLIDAYISDVIILDIRLSYISDDAFEKIIKKKISFNESCLRSNKVFYGCQNIDMDASKFNDFLKDIPQDDNGNLYHEDVLNINIKLLKAYSDWDFFYFAIDPGIQAGHMHRYSQRFSSGKGFVDMNVSGGECGLGINNQVPFGYFTQQNDCQAQTWTADPQKSQNTYICSNKNGSSYVISGGWKRLLQSHV